MAFALPLASTEAPIYDLSRPADVPCDGCTARCRGAVPVRPEWGDRPTVYETISGTDPHTGRLVLLLKRDGDGGCLYLGASGCSIYGRRTAICRSFDCRAFYLATKHIWDSMHGTGTPPLPRALLRVFVAGAPLEAQNFKA